MSKLIVPLGFIFASITVIMLFIVPGWQHFLAVRADSRHLDEINVEIDTLTKKRDALNDQIIGITKENFDRLEQMVPSAVQGPEFLVFLEQLAHVRGLSVVKLDLSGTLSTKPKIVEKKFERSSPTINTVNPVSGTNPVGPVSTIAPPSALSRVPQIDSATSGFNAVGGQAKTQTYQTLSASMEVSGSYEVFKDFLRDLESSIRITDVDLLDFSPPSGGSDIFNFKLTLKTYYQ